MGAVAAAVYTSMPSNVSPFRGRGALRAVPVGHSAQTCSACKSRAECLSVGLENDAMADLESIVAAPIRVGKGQTLYRSGDRFASVYAVRVGSFKTVLLADDGQQQVAGYHMPGEILGMDGIGVGEHDSEAVALEDSEVCAIPFDRLQRIAHDRQALQKNIHGVLAREIVRERRVVMMLGTMSAEQRLAGFLIDLSERYRARGYSSSEFVLRMTREEIGSYLGLKLETISRLLSRFQREGLLQVQGRVVKLLDLITLRQLVEHSS